jgi:hypothetical protein
MQPTHPPNKVFLERTAVNLLSNAALLETPEVRGGGEPAARPARGAVTPASSERRRRPRQRGRGPAPRRGPRARASEPHPFQPPRPPPQYFWDAPDAMQVTGPLGRRCADTPAQPARPPARSNGTLLTQRPILHTLPHSLPPQKALYERASEYVELEERVEVLNARFEVRQRARARARALGAAAGTAAGAPAPGFLCPWLSPGPPRPPGHAARLNCPRYPTPIPPPHHHLQPAPPHHPRSSTTCWTC